VNDVISFTILGFVMFMMVKGYNKLKAKEEVPSEPAAPTSKVCPECAMEIPLAAKTCPYCKSSQ